MIKHNNLYISTREITNKTKTKRILTFLKKIKEFLILFEK